MCRGACVDAKSYVKVGVCAAALKFKLSPKRVDTFPKALSYCFSVYKVHESVDMRAASHPPQFSLRNFFFESHKKHGVFCGYL